MLGGLEGLELMLLVAGALSVAMGLLLAVRAVRNVMTGLIASWFVLFGFLQVGVALRGAGLPAVFGSVADHLQFAALICFGIAYPSSALSPRQKWAMVWATIPGACLGFVSSPGWITEGFSPADVVSDTMAIVATVGVPALLAWRWARERGDHARGQLTWVLVPLLFWVVHDRLRTLVWYATVWNPTADVPSWRLLVVYAFIAVAALAVVAVGAFGAWALARSRRLEAAPARAHRRLAAVVTAIFAMSVLQFVVPRSARDGTHLVIDTLAMLTLFYGVARYRVLDLDLGIRWGVRQGTIAGFFVATFFVGTELAQQFLGETLGSSYVGIAAAGALVFALAPLQRVAERVSARAIPVAGGADAYLAYRRLQIYRAALEGALKDGAVQPWEADALRALRRELGVTDEEHALLERDLRASAEPPAAAVPA